MREHEFNVLRERESGRLAERKGETVGKKERERKTDIKKHIEGESQ